jgi:hypothetical protein
MDSCEWVANDVAFSCERTRRKSDRWMMVGAFVCCNGVLGGAFDELRDPMIIHGLNPAAAGVHYSFERGLRHIANKQPNASERPSEALIARRLRFDVCGQIYAPATHEIFERPRRVCI